MKYTTCDGNHIFGALPGTLGRVLPGIFYNQTRNHVFRQMWFRTLYVIAAIAYLTWIPSSNTGTHSVWIPLYIYAFFGALYHPTINTLTANHETTLPPAVHFEAIRHIFTTDHNFPTVSKSLAVLVRAFFTRPTHTHL